jgi:hypothetical protein
MIEFEQIELKKIYFLGLNLIFIKFRSYKHSNKFVIREIFGGIKNSAFGYNTGIIQE